MIRIIDDIQRTEDEIVELKNKLLEKKRYLQLLRTKLLIGTHYNNTLYNCNQYINVTFLENMYEMQQLRCNGLTVNNLTNEINKLQQYLIQNEYDSDAIECDLEHLSVSTSNLYCDSNFIYLPYVADLIASYNKDLQLMKKISNYFDEKLSILCVESVDEDSHFPLCPHGLVMDLHNGTKGIYYHSISGYVFCDLCHTICSQYYCGCDGVRFWCCLCTNKVSKVANYKIMDHVCKKRQFQDFIYNYPDIEVDLTTQLKNKNALDKTLDLLCSEMGDKPLSFYGLLLFDIDNFKSINDQLGHQSGDEFLRMIGDELSDMQLNPPSRYKNLWCYRDGGDEFAIIFRAKYNENNGDNVYATDIYYDLIERITRISLYFDVFDEDTTVSVGITLKGSIFDNAKQWKTTTDKAMYVAKESGKNTVRFYVNNVICNLNEIISISSDNQKYSLSSLVASLPCYGHIEYEHDTSFWYIKLCREWQDTALCIAQLCGIFTKRKHMMEYKKSLRLGISWASLLSVEHPQIACITPPSIAGLHISLGRSQITKDVQHIGQKVEFKITNIKVSEPFRKLPENIVGQYTSNDGLRYYPTLWILADIEFIESAFVTPYAPHISLATVAVQLKVDKVEELHLKNGYLTTSLTQTRTLSFP